MFMLNTVAIATLSIMIICDQACENRVYLHTKFDVIFYILQFTITLKALKLCIWTFQATLLNQSESRCSL